MTGILSERLIEQSGALVCVKKADGRYIFANNRFLEAFGIGDRFTAAVSDADLFPPDIATRLREGDKAALTQGTSLTEEEFALPGQTRFYLFNRFPLSNGEEPSLLGVVGFEITQQVKKEEDLLASRALFKGILDIAADAIISVDRGQRVILFNQGAERIFGFSTAEIIGQPLDLLLPLAARASHHHHVGHFDKQGGSRRMGQRGIIAGRRKDGTVFPAEASISRIELAGAVTYTAILRDISEAQQAQEAIQTLNADLNLRAAQLESANRELEAFSYSVSHDLRAPLRSIDGFSQVLMEDFVDLLPEEARDHLQRIRAATQRMAQLIDDMLSLSRVTRGTVNRQAVDLTALVSAISQELQAGQPDRQVTFAITPGVVGDADPHLIRIALTNLLGNAWKYTSKHTAARIEFGVRTDAQGRTLYFVKDDGAGFDMTYANKLFGVFQRLHGMNEYPGTGVGLATVQRIIHKHGGEVWAEGAIEQGATFSFTLAPSPWLERGA